MQKCDEIEDLEKINSPRVYDKIKELGVKMGVSRNNIIRDNDGNILVELDEIKNKWEEYVNMFHDNNRGDIPKFEGVLSGPPILQEEKGAAIEAMTTGKAAGEDGIVVEMIGATGDLE